MIRLRNIEGLRIKAQGTRRDFESEFINPALYVKPKNLRPDIPETFENF